MKNAASIATNLAKIIGKDNNRFYALLLFLALMFALWLLYIKDGGQHWAPGGKASQEQLSPRP